MKSYDVQCFLVFLACIRVFVFILVGGILSVRRGLLVILKTEDEDK